MKDWRGVMRKVFKWALSCTLALAMTVSGIVIADKESADVNAAVGEWKLVWSDEFNGTSLDTNTWSYEIGNGNWGWGNGEVEYYTNRTDNVKVSDGYLQIIAKKENYGGQKFTSGRIISRGKKSFKYGKMEARIRVENGNQSGVWPAFWMMGEKGGWPDCGELDIMEHANNRSNVGGCIHWNPNGFGGAYDHSYKGGDYYFTDNVNNGITAWHTYGVIWDEKHIEWTVDGKTFHTQRFNEENNYCFQQYQYFLLNLAIGGTQTPYTGGQTAPDDYKTAVMYVDWVRVSQKEEAPTTEYDGPYVTVTEDAVASYDGQWGSFFGNGWTGASGTLTRNGSTTDGFTINATSVGNRGDKDSIWGIQGQLLNLKYYAGNTYKYQCTITSDKDKKIFVKVADDAEEAIAGGYVYLKAGEPYHYETDVEIPKDFDGMISLKFGMGIDNNGDDPVSNGEAVNIKVQNVSFVTTATIPDPDYIKNQQTTEAPTETSTKSDETTVLPTDRPTKSKKVSVPKVKVKSASKKKAGKKVKISLKKVKGAKKYRIQISTSKKFKKVLVKKTFKKAKFTVKSKRLRNKKKLYVRAKAVKIVGGKSYIGKKWSRAKKVKIKK